MRLRASLDFRIDETIVIHFALEKADSVLVVAHVDPDGDAIGSLTAMGQALEQLGKRITLACDDAVPRRFRDLPMAKAVTQTPSYTQPYDLVVAVDCGDELRMGEVFAMLPEPKPSLANFDHHITNTRFGDFNLVDPAASSTAELLYRFFVELGITITPGIAESLLTGIVTDTLGFRTSNVTAETMRVAGALVDAGADLPEIYLQALILRPYSTALLWQLGLDGMQMVDGLAWATISHAEIRSVGLEGNPSSSGLVNFLGDIDVAKMGLVVSEMEDGTIRASLRCRAPYDVAEVAAQFGGGGHVLAAGCTLDGPLADAEAKLVAACREAIDRQERAIAGSVPTT